ncbi:MAG TPA: hypothetical protein VIG99_17830 [Myxococcaceae bacterium]|jgi:hypothetical protein
MAFPISSKPPSQASVIQKPMSELTKPAAAPQAAAASSANGNFEKALEGDQVLGGGKGGGRVGGIGDPTRANGDSFEDVAQKSGGTILNVDDLLA